MGCEVCSIYLFRDEDTPGTLRETEGLKADAVQRNAAWRDGRRPGRSASPIGAKRIINNTKRASGPRFPGSCLKPAKSLYSRFLGYRCSAWVKCWAFWLSNPKLAREFFSREVYALEVGSPMVLAPR